MKIPHVTAQEALWIEEVRRKYILDVFDIGPIIANRFGIPLWQYGLKIHFDIPSIPWNTFCYEFMDLPDSVRRVTEE